MQRGWWLWAIIVGVVLLTAPLLAQRAALEHDNRTVEIVADLESLRELSEWVDVPVDVILESWAELGVTSAGAVEPGDIALIRAAGLRVVPRTVQVLDALRSEGAAPARGPSGIGPFIAAGEHMPGYPDAMPSVAERLAAAGIPLGIVEFANQAGEREMARLMNDTVVFVHSIPRRELERLTDRQALARFNRAALERQARVLYVHALLPASPGDDDLIVGQPAGGGPSMVAAGAGGSGGVNARTLDLDPEERAALLARNEAYVSALVTRMGDIGLRVGAVQPLPRWAGSAVVPVAVLVAAAAGALLVLRAFVRVSWKWELAVLVAAAVAGALLPVLEREVLLRQLAAFGVAAVFPVLAVALGAGVGNKQNPGPGAPAAAGAEGRRSAGVAAATIWGLLRVMAVTAAGAALVVAALADSRFFLKLEQFRGVKLAHVLPLALVAALWALESVPALTSLTAGSARRSRGTNRGPGHQAGPVPDREPGREPSRDRPAPAVGWRHVVIAAAAALALFVMVARTGNHLLPVSAWELAAREALEEWLVVRPRTKEFLLGYPALLMGLAFFAGGRRGAGWPFVVAGTVAAISVINTFAHAHVGLAVSAVRSAYGLLLGAAVGAAGLAAWSVWERWRGSRGGRGVGPGRSEISPRPADETRMRFP